MMRTLFSLLWVVGALIQVPLKAADPVAATVEARDKAIESKVERVLSAVNVEEPEKKERARAILREWLVALRAWHQQNDPQLKTLWSAWSRARAVVPKDEFPAEVEAVKIEALYETLKPTYFAFLERLATELTPEQIDAIKERWSRAPGMQRTYNAYLQIVPDLTDEQKKVIYDRLVLAREAAMLTDADGEIVNLFKRHKVKVEAYIGSLEWAKLHKAYAKRG